MIADILYLSVINFLGVLPILIVAVLLSQFIRSYLSGKNMNRMLKENEQNIAKSAAAGIATPGPLIAYLPILKTFREKGLAISIIAAFTVGQSLIGPGRLLLEVQYFGVPFFVLRVVIAFMTAVGIATCFRLLEKRVDF